MLTPEFILESIVIALILTLYTSFVNIRQRRKMMTKMGKDCKESVRFYFKHPYLSILTNFVIFFAITVAIKLVHNAIF